MSTDNNINNFTAADIEKYHKGQLSPKEMHDLEKAAMDDPFLADALEGYANAGVNVAADMADLRNRLTERTEGAKIIPLNTDRKRNFNLLKVAAMLVFVAGAAFAVYQFGFNRKSGEIAKTEPITKEENKINDTIGLITNNPASKPAEIKTADETNNEVKTTEKGLTGPGGTTGKVNGSEKDNYAVTTDNNTAAPATVTPSSPALSNDDKEGSRKDADKKAVAKVDNIIKTEGANRQETVIVASKDKTAEKQNEEEVKVSRAIASKKMDEQNYRNQAINTFRGRVVDQNNTGVPFANVTNLDENTGTYTDARGYFNLTYPDSVLNVQIRSIGFENNNVQLRNSVASNNVVMQDDTRSLSEVVVSNKKPNLEARAGNTMKLEEPEPADGWSNYDNYLVNNLQIPEEFKSKPAHSGEVQLSFEVNKNGEPVNFKVEKSLCSKCDKEAIRLVKDGPKWKRNAKNGRTTVTITF